MQFAEDFVDCAPRTVVWSAGVTRRRDLQFGRRAGTLLLEHPVFGAVSGLTVPYGLLLLLRLTQHGLTTLRKWKKRQIKTLLKKR